MLDRFNLVATPDHNAACARLDRMTGGFRRIRDGRREGSPHIVNALRLGGLRLMANRMPACTVHSSGSVTGLLFMVLSGGVTATSGRRRVEVGPGRIACLMPTGDRMTSFLEGTQALIVSLPPDLVAETMEDWGSTGSYGWADAFAEVPDTLGSASRLFGLARDVVRLYDEEPPSPGNDGIFGHSLLAASTSMLGEMFRRSYGGGGPSYAVARRAEDAVIEHFARPMTVASLARDIGTTPARLSRSLLLHRGVNLTELRDYVRVLAADRFADAGSSAMPWQSAGFRDEQDFARARGRQAETAAKLARARRVELQR
jgi:hypothetical protein